MKKAVLLAFGFLVFTACGGPQDNEPQDMEEESMEEAIVGDDRDEHGCIGSAGESWSQLRESCIQIFNEGQMLMPVKPDVEGIGASFSAYILFNDDNSKAEIFVPKTEEISYILESTDADLFEGGIYSYNMAEGTLYVDGESEYRTRPKRDGDQ